MTSTICIPISEDEEIQFTGLNNNVMSITLLKDGIFRKQYNENPKIFRFLDYYEYILINQGKIKYD